MKKKTIWLLACAVVLILGTLAAQRPEQPRVTMTAASTDSPMGPRKILNLRGSRYAFLENGAAYDLDRKLLGESLGTIEYDILAAPEENGKKDLAATFAKGGTVYETELWDPDFRVAVELEGSFYIGERVAGLGAEPIDAAAYFAAADFADTVETLEIRDHMGLETLDTLEGKDMEALITLLSRCQPVELSNDDYPAIGQAQREGKSYKLFLNLQDGTAYSLYVIPELELAMLGDGKYSLPEDFRQSFGERFGGLIQQPLPAI